MSFRIYYADGSRIDGDTEADWISAPSNGVEVVVRVPRADGIRWFYESDGAFNTVRDRDLWTGDDEYNPFGWGAKLGQLIPRVDYDAIWRRACGDD